MEPTDFLFFRPEVISPAVEAAFLQNLQLSKASAADGGVACAHAPWNQLKRRKLILAGAVPSSSQHLAPTTREQQGSLPPWIIDPALVAAVNTHAPAHVERFNDVSELACSCHSTSSSSKRNDEESQRAQRLNVLINEYESPHGINLHTDGPAFAPAVCIISFASMVPILFTPVASSDGMEQLRMKMNGQQQQQPHHQKQSDDLYGDDEDEDTHSDDDDDDEDSSARKPEWAVKAAVWNNLLKRSDLISQSALKQASSARLSGLQDLRLASPSSRAVLLPPRSLVVFSGPFYENFLHGILDNSFVDILPRSKVSNFDSLLAAFPPAATIDLSSKAAPVTAADMKQLLSSIQLMLKISKNKRDSKLTTLPSELEPFRGKWIRVMNSNNSSDDEEFFLGVRDRIRVSLTYRKVAKTNNVDE